MESDNSSLDLDSPERIVCSCLTAGQDTSLLGRLEVPIGQLSFIYTVFHNPTERPDVGCDNQNRPSQYRIRILDGSN